MRLWFYSWMFGTSWMPRRLRVWACRKGGAILVKRLDEGRPL